MRKISLVIFLTLSILLLNGQDEDSTLFNMSMQGLFDMEVQSASGINESYVKAPASMIVITAEEIKQRGYLSLDEVMMDLPGFDISVSNGTTYMQAYQRGYRTPFTQRTLIMINGKVDNHLWSHTANISRQYPINIIERIEVMYGPASAVYGPNAFLGIFNIITKTEADSEEDIAVSDVSVQFGNNNTYSVDLYTGGKKGELSYSLGAKTFRSDEADLSDKFGFVADRWYGDTAVWGPMLSENHRGVNYGEYADPTDDWGLIGQVNYKGLTLGINSWVRKEAYGAYYAADRAQNNTMWNYSSNQIYADYSKAINDQLNVNTTLLYRTNRIWGGWVEATPMWDSIINNNGGVSLTLADRGRDNSAFSDYSFISKTNWHSVNNSWLFKQNFNYEVNDKLRLLGGIKYERKELTRAYDIPGYWGAFSSVGGNDMGPHGQGGAIGNSTDSEYTFYDLPAADMPERNLIFTTDYGGFLQSSVDVNNFRFVGGIRFDKNSLYGSSVNPRVSAMYVMPDESMVFKLVYGEAFQEPAPIQLFGGWNGRAANPDLKPEKAKNLELITMFQHQRFFHQLTVFASNYENVIKEEAENAGERDVMGLEYSVKTTLFNPISSRDISLYAFYTYTKTTSSVSYNFDTGLWEDASADLGDIAPHKIHAGFNVPIKNYLNVNIRGQYIHDKLLYLRNPLRGQGEKLDGYFNMDANVYVTIKNVSVGMRVRNLLNADYFHSGVESASAGNNFDERSQGFHNSLLPQAGTNYLVYLRLNY